MAPFATPDQVGLALAKYEFLGILMISVFTIEVAVYAILAAMASRLGKYLFVCEQSYTVAKPDITDLFKETEKDFADKRAFNDFKKKINLKLKQFEAPLNNVLFIRRNTRIGRALLLPVSFVLVALVVYLIGLSSGTLVDYMFFAALALMVVSGYFEVNVLRAIDRVLTWLDPDDTEKSEEATSAVSEQLNQTPLSKAKKEDFQRFFHIIELNTPGSNPKYVARTLAGFVDDEDRMYFCPKCSNIIRLAKGEVLPLCAKCGNDRWANLP
jgi:hypothetical protein